MTLGYIKKCIKVCWANQKLPVFILLLLLPFSFITPTILKLELSNFACGQLEPISKYYF